jgi:Lon-like ATP-dependent protease
VVFLLNKILNRFFFSVLNRFAQKRQVYALEQTITVFLHQYNKHPDQLYFLLCEISNDSRWVLRYLAGRELGRFFSESTDTAIDIWLKLADDEYLYVREGVARGITYAAETQFNSLWPSWQKAFFHPSDRVRQTAAMTFISFIEKHKEHDELHPVLEVIKKDPSPKVRAIYENYIVPLQQCNIYDSQHVVDDFITTEDLPIPTRLIDQVVGQNHAVNIIKLAAHQRRSVLMIGEPGTGKSMLGQAMAELLPSSALEDIVVEAADTNSSIPKVRSLPSGEAEFYIRQSERNIRANDITFRWIIRFAYVVTLFVAFFYYIIRDDPVYMMAGAVVIGLLFWFSKSMKTKSKDVLPKYLVNNTNKKQAPFIDATGLHAGALLGDIRHDPYQSGGLETKSHRLVEPGAIHLAHQGVLFIDEVSTLSVESQQALLTAFQEKKSTITGRSPGSSGTMISTEPVPSDFVMVLAGNMPDVDKIHPALRSRIRGYGYEVYMNSTMQDTVQHRYKIAQFIAQEVRRDGKIPHFTCDAVEVVIQRAKEMSPYPHQLTARFRELGGLIRTAGDIAIQACASIVEREHVVKALGLSRTLEEQRVIGKYIGKTATFTPYPGYVQALTVDGQILRIISIEQPLNHVDLKFVEDKLWERQSFKIEAVLNQLGMNGRYYIQIEGTSGEETLDEISLAIMAAIISAKLSITIPSNVAVSGGVNITGLVTETSYFQKQIQTAKQLGIRKIIAPAVQCTEELPKGIEYIWVRTIDEIIQAIQVYNANAKREG